MRFGYLHSMTPAQRMDVLEAQYPTNSRRALFDICGPGEYSRLLRGVPTARLRTWHDSMSATDRDAWVKYNSRTAEQERKDAAVLDVLRPRYDKLLAEHPYYLDVLTLLPRLLGDPVDTAGVRLYFRREALGGSPGIFERTYALDELIPQLERLQRWGAAPFVALQDIPYGQARTNANVRRARVFTADWDAKHDQAPPEELLAAYPPDLFVRSGGGYHAYWLLGEEESRGLPLHEWRQVGLALCRALNADEDAVLGSQLLRLPGSVHIKNPMDPRRVYILDRRAGEPRADVVDGLTRAFSLKLRNEDGFNAIVGAKSIDIDPEEHPALAYILSELEDQGLCPTPVSRGWTYFCPVHEVQHIFAADLDSCTNQAFVPRPNSTPSGILRVNEDKSLAFFCGSTQRCGAGPRDLLLALGLDPDLTWLECGGFLQSDYGKRWKAARIADGTWRGRTAPAKPPTPPPPPSDTQERWTKLTGI
jgi:hypothetical protein